MDTRKDDFKVPIAKYATSKVEGQTIQQSYTLAKNSSSQQVADVLLGSNSAFNPTNNLVNSLALKEIFSISKIPRSLSDKYF